MIPAAATRESVRVDLPASHDKLLISSLHVSSNIRAHDPLTRLSLLAMISRIPPEAREGQADWSVAFSLTHSLRCLGKHVHCGKGASPTSGQRHTRTPPAAHGTKGFDSMRVPFAERVVGTNRGRRGQSRTCYGCSSSCP